MKYFISLFMILSILVLSGCSVKNSVQNDLYDNQTSYYQDENLTKYEQDTKLDNMPSQRNMAKDIIDTLLFLPASLIIFLPILIDIGIYLAI